MSSLYATSVPVLAAVTVLSLAGALELGFRLSRVFPVVESQLTTIAAPVLSLVGLLLAFSFSMAADRLALRRAAAVEEANSIGTFWLRTSLVPQPRQSEMRRHLRHYVDLHLEHRTAGVQEAKTTALEADAARVHEELWSLLLEDAQGAPEARTLLLTAALNELIDDEARVLSARENHLPDAIFAYLFVLVVVASVVVGYRPPGEKRNLILWAMFALVVSGVIVVLIDMDRPRRGLIQTDTAPYLRLRESMQ